jgi:hypothetical protein
LKTSSRIPPLKRFRDESVGGLREGPLKGEKPEENVLLYQARIGGRVYSGIRVFHRLARYVTFFRIDEKGLLEEVDDNWKKVYRFVSSSPASLDVYRPSKLTLVYGFTDFECSYSAVFTLWGTFTFVEADTAEVISCGLPVRDLKGRDFEIASVLFTPPQHSFLSLKALNLL